MRELNIPSTEADITEEKVCKNYWYTFFYNVYYKIIGYLDSSLIAIIFKNNETKGNAGSSETEIHNFLIKKDNFKEKDEIVNLYAVGTYAENANNKTINLKLNSTTFYTKTVATSGGTWMIKVKIINLGTTQKIFVDNGVYNYTTTSIDTSTNDIEIFLTLQGISDNDLVKEYFEISYSS